jgi:flagellar protein FliO/FliZ
MHLLSNALYSLSLDWTTQAQFVVRFFSSIFMVLVVALLAYYTTKLIASARFSKGGKKNLEHIESIGVGPQSYIHIIRAGKKYVLIGVTKGNVNFLTELDEESLSLDGQRLGFESFMSRFQKKDSAEQDKNEGGQ